MYIILKSGNNFYFNTMQYTVHTYNLSLFTIIYFIHSNAEACDHGDRDVTAAEIFRLHSSAPYIIYIANTSKLSKIVLRVKYDAYVFSSAHQTVYEHFILIKE